MSVLISMEVNGDTGCVQRSLTKRADEFVKIADRAAIHHRFGIGDGYVLVIDEWETAEQFQTFFTDPALQAFIGEICGDTSSPPEMTITEAVSSPTSSDRSPPSGTSRPCESPPVPRRWHLASTTPARPRRRMHRIHRAGRTPRCTSTQAAKHPHLIRRSDPPA